MNKGECVMGALSGIKVLDLTRLLPGPYCTLMLADYGAEVIKIEEPGRGDYIRSREPSAGGIGARHLTVNRNKKSMELNLKTESGIDIFNKMAREADVIIEGFRPGVMDRLGIGYEQISTINPQIVYCSLTGYGQTGPYRSLPGHDINYAGYSGILGLNGEADGRPVIPGVQIADIGGGSLMALSGILMALLHKEKTGKGQYIDVSMTDGAVTWLYAAASDYFVSGDVPERGKNRLDGQFAYYQIYETKDGKFLSIGASEKKFWERFCELVERPDWKELHGGDAEVQAKLKQDLTALFKERTKQQWMALLSQEETCVGPVNTIEELFDDPQIQARGMLCEHYHPLAGMTKQIGFPIKFSTTSGELHAHAPILGEHTGECLNSLGYTEQEIRKLREENVIGNSPSIHQS